MGLLYTSLMSRGAEHLFMCLLAICIFPKYLFRSTAWVFLFFFFFDVELCEFFEYFYFNPLSDI